MVSSVQFSSVAQLCPTLRDPMDGSIPGFLVHHQHLELPQIQVDRVGDAIQSSDPLLSLYSPSSIFPSIGVFSKESVLHIRWPKYWNFYFSIIPSSEYSGLISFRMDWLHLLAVQWTLKSLLQHRSSKASILQCSALKSINDYWENLSFTRQTFVGKVMSLLFSMLFFQGASIF